ncbi:ATP-dependent DNA ligase [Cohnella sp. CFH 77786]|uniref:ATP-dependent DNA ligase n=1 Tax=Cohnella sp. CFH 77786 TaxID=2662265 RepID=UPI001C610E50|nr:ATP-dependent DNA ligase [Cohnella sp. CFH 77786]
MFYTPMLLNKRENPFDDDRYLYEPKVDGHRLLLSMDNGKVRLFTRHQFEVTAQYPELHNVPIDDPSDVVLDGEVAYVNPETGDIEFETVMERFHKRKYIEIRQASVNKPVVYYAFDILRYKGEDMRNKPLTERKALLERVLTNNSYYNRVFYVDGAGISLFQLMKERGLEGIVAKRKESVYVGRRSENWLKIINYTYANVEIAGYRRSQFGWLAQQNGKPAGIIELAVPAAHKQAFYGVAKALKTGEKGDFVYVEPRIRARVRSRGWTRNGLLRSPEFVEFLI